MRGECGGALFLYEKSPLEALEKDGLLKVYVECEKLKLPLLGGSSQLVSG